MIRTVIVLLPLVAACAAQPVAPAADPGEQAVIYGNDDRLDYYQITDPQLRALADATAGMFSSSELRQNANGTWTLPSSPSLSQNYSPMCSNEPFRSQLALASCSGFLVGPDTLATAGHCISSSSCSTTRWVFGFRMDSSSSARTTVAAEDVYRCSSILSRSTSNGDYALVRLDRPVTGRAPMSVRRSGTPPDGTPLILLGHPSGIPIKVAGNATVKDSSSTYLEANVDAYGGNSGSPVVNAGTLEVEGILVRGQTDYTWTGSCYRSNTCSDSTGCPDFESITRATLFDDAIPSSTAPACVDDAREDDDSLATARAATNGTISGLEICADDDDWFAIDVPAGGTVTVSIAFRNADGDLDLQLYNAAGSLVQTSESTTNAESVSTSVSRAARVYARVYGYQGAAAGYSITIRGADAGGGPIPGGSLQLAASSTPRAGSSFTLDVTDAPPGEPITFVVGSPLGTIDVPGCPGLVAPIGSPIVLGSSRATAAGTATLSVNVPSTVSGSWSFMAASVATCELSNERSFLLR